jgi:hypothetical protein
MSLLERCLLAARRSRHSGYRRSVLSGPDEAVRLAAEIADALRQMSDRDRTLFLSDLGELKEALRLRCEVLKQDIEQNRAELMRLTRTLVACNAYALAASKTRTALAAQQSAIIRSCR